MSVDVTWHSFDWLTGRRGPELTVAELPPMTRRIAEPTELMLRVLVHDAERDDSSDDQPTEAGTVPGWDAATRPGLTMLVALDGDERILWGGLVLRRVDVGDSWVDCSLVSPEGYLDRRYTGAHAYTDTNQGAVAEGLLNAAVGDLEADEVDSPTSTIYRDRTYLDGDDKTVLSALTELHHVNNGPDFTCEVEWTDATHTALKRVWVVRDRLGTQSTASFERPGSVTSYEYLEDYSSDNGANDVLAYSSGEGDSRPESDHFVDIQPGWARFEERWTPSTSIKRKARLDKHAEARLARMRDGWSGFKFEAHLSSAPLAGSDWHLGDDVYVSITSPRFPAHVDVNGAMVPGLVRWERVVGYTIDPGADRLIPETVEAD